MPHRASLPPRGDTSLNALIRQPVGTIEFRPLQEWNHQHPGNHWKSSLQIEKPWDWQVDWPYNLPIGDPVYHNENSTYQSKSVSFEQPTS